MSTSSLIPTTIKLDDHCMLWDNQTVWPNRTGGMGQTGGALVPECHMVAGLYSNEIFQFRDDPRRYICSSHLQVLYLILRYLRCSISFVVSNANFGGFRDNQTNRWTGILSLFDEDEEQMDPSAKMNQSESAWSSSKPLADFIPHLFSLAYGREEVIYMERVIPQNHLLTILSYSKYSNSDSPTKLFDGFQLSVWLLILLSITMFGLISIAIRFTKFSQLNHYEIVSTYLEMFAILLGEVSRYMLGSSMNQHRNPLFIWLFASFLIRLFYSTDITAMFLTRTRNIIDRFDQITQHNQSVTILIKANSPTKTIFTKMFPWTLHMLRHFEHNEMSTVETIGRLVSENTVMVANRMTLTQIQKAYWSQIQLHVSDEGFMTFGANFAIRKSLDPVYQKKLSRIFYSIFCFGLNEKINQIFVHNNLVSLHKQRPELGLNELLLELDRTNSTKQIIENLSHQSNSQFTLSILLSVFLTGIFLSCFTLIVELVLTSRLVREWHRIHICHIIQKFISKYLIYRSSTIIE